MKTITDRINENLYDTTKTGLECNDSLTRSFNNLFGMMGITMRVVNESTYVITGTPLRNREALAQCVTTLGNSRLTFDTWLRECGLNIIDWPLGDYIKSEHAQDQFNPEVLSRVQDMVKDNDYMVVSF